MKKTLAIYENISIKDLRMQLSDAHKKLSLLRLQNSVKTLKKTHEITVLRRKIAHISTVLTTSYKGQQ